MSLGEPVSTSSEQSASCGTLATSALRQSERRAHTMLATSSMHRDAKRSSLLFKVVVVASCCCCFCCCLMHTPLRRRGCRGGVAADSTFVVSLWSALATVAVTEVVVVVVAAGKKNLTSLRAFVVDLTRHALLLLLLPLLFAF